MNTSQLAELEDDIQLQLARTEERVRVEVSSNYCYVMSFYSHHICTNYTLNHIKWLYCNNV